MPTSSASAPVGGIEFDANGNPKVSVPVGGIEFDANGNPKVTVPGRGLRLDENGHATASSPGLGDSRIGDFGSTGTVTLEGGLELKVSIVSADIADISITKGKAEWAGSYVTNFAGVSALENASFTIKGAQLSPQEDIDTGVAVASGVVTLEGSFDCRARLSVAQERGRRAPPPGRVLRLAP